MPGFLFLTPTFARKQKGKVFPATRSSPGSRSHSPEPGNGFLLLNNGNTSDHLSIPVSALLSDAHSMPLLSDDQPSPPVNNDGDDASLFDSIATDSPQVSELLNLTAEQSNLHDASTDNNNSDDGEVDHCCEHDHFSLQVIDEILNIPVDAVFSHCFTDSLVYRDFVAARKTFDVVLSSWPDEPEANGTKVRNIAYTLSLNYSIGPKVSQSTERQIMYSESKPGHLFLIDTECINAGIPYGENFYVINRYCISRISSTRCRFRITSQIKYRKSVWGLVKNFIDKNVTAGIKESFGVLADLLRQESNRELASLPKVPHPLCGLARKKVLRRKRMSTRTTPKPVSTSFDAPHHPKPADQPIRRRLSKVGTTLRDRWDLQLTFDGLVRIIVGVLFVLVVFNVILFNKLWTLEKSTSTLFHSKLSYYDASTAKDPPKSSQEWLRLLDHQHQLHEAEVNQWKEILSTSIELLDQMTQTLTQLRSSLDERSVYKRETPRRDEPPTTTTPVDDQ